MLAIRPPIDFPPMATAAPPPCSATTSRHACSSTGSRAGHRRPPARQLEARDADAARVEAARGGGHEREVHSAAGAVGEEEEGHIRAQGTGDGAQGGAQVVFSRTAPAS